MAIDECTPDCPQDVGPQAFVKTLVTGITPEPRLLPIEGSIWWVDSIPVGPMNITSAAITYKEHGRDDSTESMAVSFPPDGSKYMHFKFDFGDVVQGGSFDAVGTVTLQNVSGGSPYSQSVRLQYDITGTNPSKKDVKSRLGSLQLQVIAYKETLPKPSLKFGQFDSYGQPQFGGPNGFGIMQLDTPPATASEIWNWKENVDAGKDLYATKIEQLTGYFRKVYRRHPLAPHLTPAMLNLAYYQYYNGGVYWQWNVRARRWEKTGNTTYGDDAQRIEDLVNGGTPPPGWS